MQTFGTTSHSEWFTQVEALFAIRWIEEDDTMFNYVLTDHDTKTDTGALSILASPPVIKMYSYLKQLLMSVFAQSEDRETAAALFNLSGLDGSNPSEPMGSMFSLLGTHPQYIMFKHLFLQQLPYDVT